MAHGSPLDPLYAWRPVFNLEGEREVLWLWLGPVGSEGPSRVGDDAQRASSRLAGFGLAIFRGGARIKSRSGQRPRWET
jgi:hypothetical protein